MRKTLSIFLAVILAFACTSCFVNTPTSATEDSLSISERTTREKETILITTSPTTTNSTRDHQETTTEKQTTEPTTIKQTTAKQEPTTKKQEPATKQTTQKAQNSDSNDSGYSRTVYVTPSGERYHFISSCGGKNSRATTLSEAKSSGRTPCKKCAS